MKEKQRGEEGNHQEKNIKNIKIFNACEGQTENSVTRVTVWHHEACRRCRTVIPS